MPAKRSHSATRALTLLETIAEHQPIGVRALAKLLDEDKSAVHRGLATLAHGGWIRTAGEPPVRWELTAHILAVAYAAHGGIDLRRRARAALERLRDATNETVILALPDARRFLVGEVVESRQSLRIVPELGDTIPIRHTATGLAVLPYLSSERQEELLGGKPDRHLLDAFARTRARGYSVSEGEIYALATNLASPILDFDEQPIGAVVVCGPQERMTSCACRAIGPLLVQTTRELTGSRQIGKVTVRDRAGPSESSGI